MKRVGTLPKNDRARRYCSGPARGAQDGCQEQNSDGVFQCDAAMTAADGTWQDTAAAFRAFCPLVIKNGQQPADRAEHQADEKPDDLVVAGFADGRADGTAKQGDKNPDQNHWAR